MRKFLCLTVLLTFFIASRAYKGNMTAKRNVVSGSYNFWVYTPEDYQAGGHRFPLIIFLHGASLCGNNLDRVRRYGVLDAIEKGKDIPYLVMAPQNSGGSWSPSKINGLLEWMEANYQVDTTRIYVLGMSLGGYGTLDFVGSYPHKVAAAMALCGGCTLKDVQGLGQVPLWIMHGTADRAVSIQQSKCVVEKLQEADNDKLLRYDWFEGGNHGFLARLFYLKQAYDWLTFHSLKDNPRTIDRTFGISRTDMNNAYNDIEDMSEMYNDD